jgi:TPR repeat protein
MTGNAPHPKRPAAIAPAIVLAAVSTIVTLTPAGPLFAQDLQGGAEAARRGDYETALVEWRPLADSGDAAAQFNVGMMYARGDGVPEDFAEAARWFRLASEQGQTDAQARLGGMYARGIGLEKDYLEAARWLTMAAERHHAESQYDLGTLYANGNGVVQDYTTAYFWFSLAALQRFFPAMDAQARLKTFMVPGQIAMTEQMVQDWLEETRHAWSRESNDS